MFLTSIVIVTHDQLEYSQLCVDSLRRRTPEPHELIVVDNHSTDGSVEFFHSIRNAKVIVNSTNRGFPAAANQGIGASSGDAILLLNNDTIATDGWLSRLTRALRSEPKVGLVGPVSNFVSGGQCVPVDYGWTAGTREWAGCSGGDFMLRWAGAMDDFANRWAASHQGRLLEVPRLVGFCLLIRREVIDRVGLFDERFGIGNFEDDDYCRRAREAGYKLVIAMDSFVHHFGGRTFMGAGVEHEGLLRRNEQLYRQKWGLNPQAADAASGPLDIRQHVSTISTDVSAATPSESAAVSLCMIARDNERTIGAALRGIRDYVDDIVVVDTGSKDTTPRIAADLGARVFHFPWIDDFSAARNESIRHALGQWIFWMDTDDSIDSENARKVQALARGTHPNSVMGFLMQVRDPVSNENGDTEFIAVDQVKLLRNLPQLRFEFRIHEQILLSIRRAGGTVAWTDIFVTHSGSDKSAEAQARKLERDLRILDLDYREHPDHPFVLFNLGMTLEQAGRAQEAVNFLWQSIGRSGSDDSHLRKAYALLVACYRNLGRPATALETCQQGIQRFPCSPRTVLPAAV